MAAFRLIRVISIRLPTGISPDTRDFNSAPHFRCVVADRTSLYRECYPALEHPALEHAYHVQVVIEQYEGLTSEE